MSNVLNLSHTGDWKSHPLTHLTDRWECAKLPELCCHFACCSLNSLSFLCGQHCEDSSLPVPGSLSSQSWHHRVLGTTMSCLQTGSLLTLSGSLLHLYQRPMENLHLRAVCHQPGHHTGSVCVTQCQLSLLNIAFISVLYCQPPVLPSSFLSLIQF